MGYEEVIHVLGDFGRYQKRIYFLLCLPAILCAFHKLANVFLIAEPHQRCRLPFETKDATYSINETLFPEYYPYDTINKKYSECEIIIDNKTEKCTEYIYDHSVYGYTTVIEWDLTCSKTYLVATGNALFMFGVMLGSIIFGQLSDRYGRKLIFFISLILQVTAGILASVAPEFWSFTFARMIIGSTTSGVFLVAYVIALEMVSANKRPIAGTVCQMFFSVGYMLTAVFAIYIDNWRTLQLALSLPGLCFLCYWWFIPESVRWLLSKNRLVEAKELIQRAAKENRVHVTDNVLDEMLISEIEKTDNPGKKESTVLDIFKYPKLRRRALIIFFDWFACNITYYGLSWSTNNLGGNPYINFVLSGLVEIPAYAFLIVVLNRWGRKRVQCGCMIVAGMALLSSLIISADQYFFIVLAAMVGKLAVTSAYGTIYIFSTEQFPTVIRNAGLGACSTCARVGSVLAPYINVLNKIWQPLPLVIFGIITLIGGVLSLLLPETLNKKLPETMEEGESFGQ
ncbi:organic cation transporter protein isoform X2 [Coccinella septempunctata]|nr:organic cation transporter protein isoform X2 [Coccinella septempunctata]